MGQNSPSSCHAGRGRSSAESGRRYSNSVLRCVQRNNLSRYLCASAHPKQHMLTDHPFSCYVGLGPPRRLAALQHNGRFSTFRVADFGLRRRRSVSGVLREPSERCSSPPRNGRRASAQHQCGELAIGRVNARVRRSNSSVGAACCWHGSLTPETASDLVNVMGQEGA